MRETHISVTEAKQRLGELIKRVKYGGESVVIEFRGKPQVVIRRYGERRQLSIEEDVALSKRMREFRERIAAQSPKQDDSVEIIRQMRDERDEQLFGLR